jgi:predicted lipoprotein with Yx(FWY)xxD motif
MRKSSVGMHKSAVDVRKSLIVLAGAWLIACVSAVVPAADPPPIVVTGGMLVNAQGMTLYTFDRDKAGSGKSNCNSDCAQMWPPLVWIGAGEPAGAYTLIQREGGQKQWAYKGKPLYLFSGDVNPNDTTGEGVNGVWHIAKP